MSPTIVRNLAAENALWQQTAVSQYDELLENSRRSFSKAIASNIEQQMAQLSVLVHIIGAEVQSIQPPAALVTVYRDVLNAHQESQDSVNQAVAQRLHSLPVTRAEIESELADVRSVALEKVIQAEGDVMRFSQLADAYQQHPSAFRFEKQTVALEAGLKDRAVTIVDPRFDKQDYRVWGAPLLLPSEPVQLGAAK